jgi:hypothetical protein
MTPGVGARVVFLPASTRLIAANAAMMIDFIVLMLLLWLWRSDSSNVGLL